jgi:hypothetical protein
MDGEVKECCGVDVLRFWMGDDEKEVEEENRRIWI